MTHRCTLPCQVGFHDPHIAPYPVKWGFTTHTLHPTLSGGVLRTTHRTLPCQVGFHDSHIAPYPVRWGFTTHTSHPTLSNGVLRPTYHTVPCQVGLCQPPVTITRWFFHFLAQSFRRLHCKLYTPTLARILKGNGNETRTKPE